MKKYQEVKALHDAGATLEEIDAAVRRDDLPALISFRNISGTQQTAFAKAGQQASGRRISGRTNDLRRALGYGGMVYQFTKYLYGIDEAR